LGLALRATAAQRWATHLFFSVFGFCCGPKQKKAAQAGRPQTN